MRTCAGPGHAQDMQEATAFGLSPHRSRQPDCTVSDALLIMTTVCIASAADSDLSLPRGREKCRRAGRVWGLLEPVVAGSDWFFDERIRPKIGRTHHLASFGGHPMPGSSVHFRGSGQLMPHVPDHVPVHQWHGRDASLVVLEDCRRTRVGMESGGDSHGCERLEHDA